MKQKHEFTISMKVEEACTAAYIGSGELPVLATPALAALAENASLTACADLVSESETTVGGHLEISHLVPTPTGRTVTVTSTMTRRVGRKLHFAFTACCDGRMVAEGKHLRHIVDRRRFMAKATGK